MVPYSLVSRVTTWELGSVFKNQNTSYDAEREIGMGNPERGIGVAKIIGCFAIVIMARPREIEPLTGLTPCLVTFPRLARASRLTRVNQAVTRL
jgi:hypothetical protein